MRRHLNALIASFAFAVLHFPPALAISNGVIDTDHRNVGAMAIVFEPGVVFFPCSATLISPRIFLVAAQRGGDAVCGAESIASRLDIPQARAFLGQFVTLP